MHPFLFRIGSLELGTYPVVLALAAIVGGVYLRALTRTEIAPGRLGFCLLFNLLVLGAAVGGSAYAAASRLAGLAPAAGDWLHSGLPTLGVLAGVAGASLGFAALERTPALGTLDAVFRAVPLIHGIAKCGCFLAGCCYGRVAPAGLSWAVRFPPTPELPARLWGVPLHPAQLYEAAGDFVLALGLTLPVVRRAPRGAAFFSALGGAVLLRLGAGCFRGDEARLAALPLTPSQATAALLAVGALAGLLWVLGRARHRDGLAARRGASPAT